MIRRRTLLGSASLLLGAAPAWAQGRYPSRPVTVNVPFPAGGSTDIPTRLILDRVAKDMGASFVVQNQPGAGGRIGVGAALRHKADGYSLVVVNHANTTIPLAFGQQLSYAPMDDIHYIAPFVTIPVTLMVNPRLPFATLKEFVAHVKQNPGKINIGTAGLGTMSHLAGEMFKQSAGLDVQFVHYKGDAASTVDVIAGHLPALFIGGGSNFHTDGRLRALAVSSEKRLSSLADVPSFTELGYSGVKAVAWNGLAAQRAVPDDIAQALNAGVQAALAQSEITSALRERGFEPYVASRAVFAQRVAEEVRTYQALRRATGIELS